jgi:hypothetical protein
MTSLGDLKIPLYPQVNGVPRAPTTARAANATWLLVRFNELIDQLIADFDSEVTGADPAKVTALRNRITGVEQAFDTLTARITALQAENQAQGQTLCILETAGVAVSEAINRLLAAQSELEKNLFLVAGNTIVPGIIFLDAGGTTDNFYSGGGTYSGELITGNSINDKILSTIRFGGNFSYAVPVANGAYSVKIGFVELYWNSPGQRLFSVIGQGQELLSNYDIWLQSGGNGKPIVENFELVVTNGVLNLDFVSTAGDAQVNYIQIIPIQP